MKVTELVWITLCCLCDVYLCFFFFLPLERIRWTTIRRHLRSWSSPITRKPRRTRRRRTGTEQHVTATGQRTLRCERPYLWATRPLPSTDVWLNVCDAHNNNEIYYYRYTVSPPPPPPCMAHPVWYLLPPPRHCTYIPIHL